MTDSIQINGFTYDVKDKRTFIRQPKSTFNKTMASAAFKMQNWTCNVAAESNVRHSHHLVDKEYCYNLNQQWADSHQPKPGNSCLLMLVLY